MKFLTRERLFRGWSKAELARRAGLHPSQVGQIEAGRVAPYDSQVRKLAAAFDWPESDGQRLLEEVAEGALRGWTISPTWPR